MNQEINHIAAKTTEVGTYITGGGTAVGGFMGWLNDYGIAVGAICAIVTCAANLYFKWREVRAREKSNDL